MATNEPRQKGTLGRGGYSQDHGHGQTLVSFVVDDVVDVVDIVDVVDVDGDTDDDEPSWWSELHTDHGE